MDDMLGYAELAKRLKVDHSTVARIVDRVAATLQITVHRGKQDRCFLSRDDAEKLVAHYEARRGPIDDSADEAAKFNRYGFFYIIQLVPEALPDRVKIGFADNVQFRLAQHRTAAPTAKLLKSWPCKRSWDYAAMDSITREGCKLVLNEVFEGDIEGILKRAEKFFAVMPSHHSERDLSEHSPLNGRATDSEADLP